VEVRLFKRLPNFKNIKNYYFFAIGSIGDILYDRLGSAADNVKAEYLIAAFLILIYKICDNEIICRSKSDTLDVAIVISGDQTILDVIGNQRKYPHSRVVQHFLGKEKQSYSYRVNVLVHDEKYSDGELELSISSDFSLNWR